jgi:hypothetical protein
LTLEISDHFKRSPVTIGGAIIKVEDLLRKDKSLPPHPSPSEGGGWG